MTPYEVFLNYLAFKNHFSKKTYDYHKYNKKAKASIQSYYKRKDRFFFEKMSRQKTEKEIENFFLSNFVSSDDPASLWIGEIIKEGEKKYHEWQKRNQSLAYIFKEESVNLFEDHDLGQIFNCSKGHPVLLKKFLSKKISLETMVIYEKIFSYIKNFDKKLNDPVWESVSFKIKKYNLFLNIDIFSYKKVLKTILTEK